jgi:alpha 1,2-mannosyltransferase
MRLLVIVVLLTCYFSLCSGGIESSIESGGSAVVGATTAHLRSRQNLWQNYSTAYEEVVAAEGPLPHIDSRYDSVDEQDIARARRQWQRFLTIAPTYPTHLFSTPRGIVTTAAKDLLPLLYSHIRLLRFYGCTLPVEIFISRQIDGAVNETEVKAFAAVNASISDIDDFVPTSLTVSAREHPTRPFIMKHLAIVSSSCEECIFLDADNMPVRDLRYLFDDVHYHEAGLLLCPDFWHFPPNGHSYIREIFDDNDTESSSWLPRRDIRTVESGQMVVNKRKSWKSLMLATFMQVQTLFYDNLLRKMHVIGGQGDKETFLYGALASGGDFYMVKYPVGTAGYVAKTFCGLSMVQFDNQGRILFLHSNLFKYGHYANLTQATVWQEDLRKFDLVRILEKEDQSEVYFQPKNLCPSWALSFYKFTQSNLRKEVGFDIEVERFMYLRQYFLEVGGW